MSTTQHGYQQDVSNPQLTIVIVLAALLATIIANTAIIMEGNRKYKWWYGLLKVVFYFGSFALAITTGGWSAGIASISTYLGMELNKLTIHLNLNGIIGRVLNGNGSSQQDKESTDKADH